MRITATATRTGITVCKDGEEAGRRDVSLKVNWKGYHGINTDEAERLLEAEGLAVMHWFWNAEKGHCTALLLTLEDYSLRFPPMRYAGRNPDGSERWAPAA